MSQVQIPNLDHCIWRARINHLCKSGLDPIDCKSSFEIFCILIFINPFVSLCRLSKLLKLSIFSNKSFPWGFIVVCLHDNDWAFSCWICIAQTWIFFCVLLTPICMFDFQQFAIGGYFILKTEAGEDVFISSIANQVYGNEKYKQHSNWSELELSTADRVIPTKETKW